MGAAAPDDRLGTSGLQPQPTLSAQASQQLPFLIPPPFFLKEILTAAQVLFF